jgi:DNA polymerase-3 subunit alpha
MGAIKGVGESAIEELLNERERNGLFIGLYDLCKRVDLRKVNRRVLEALIKAGALDSIAPNRAAHLAELSTALRVAEQHGKMAQTGQNDLFGLGGATDTSDDDEADAYTAIVEAWSEKDRLEAEKQTLGLFLTGHPIAEYLPELKHITHGTLGSLQADAERSKGRMEARVAGLVVDIRTRQTKQGKTMGFAVLDDSSARLEIATFSNVYDKYRDLIGKDKILIAEGALAVDDFTGNLRLTTEKLYSMEQAREAFARGITLECHNPQGEMLLEFVERLQSLLSPYCGGQCPIYIEYVTDQARASLQLGEDWRVFPSDELLLRLRRWLSAEQVSVKYK